MKLRLSLIAFALLLAALFAACGPSQEELDATSTAVAASIFATQTAEAPTVTPTPTNTPTPTPTNTPAPTDTPEPKGTADQAALLQGALPTGDDLPQGFQQLPAGLLDTQLGEGTADTLGPTAMFMNINTSEFVATVLTPLSSGLQRSIFEQQMQDPEQLANMVGLGMQLGGAGGAEVEYEPLTVEGIGETAAGVQARISMAGSAMVYDMVLFQSGDVGAVVGVLHLDGVEPEVDVFGLARMVEGRLSQLAEDQNGS